MKIDNNPVEIEAMAAFRRHDNKEGQRLQEEFLKLFHESVQCGEEFCPCSVSCKHHGRCVECVVIHRGHNDHLPHCMQDMDSYVFDGAR